jgi:hypothetical protein
MKSADHPEDQQAALDDESFWEALQKRIDAAHRGRCVDDIDVDELLAGL